ncbi:MAG: hypothetical protein Q8908_16370, partial [Bacteroidota bacterium]|nr:hypothetical protein [Bacteroidota bacterium]
FYELVYYPVVSAALMNKKFLYRDKCYLYAKQNRTSAFDYADLSRQAYDSIVSETNYYNNQLAGGKWKYMMSMNPRDLPVYQGPVIPNFVIDKSGLFDVIPEGFKNKDSALISGSSKKLSMPVFNHYTDRKYFIDVFLNDNQRVEWTSAINANWIKLSQEKGVLEGISSKKQTRIWVSIDWKNAPANEKLSGQIRIKVAGKEFIVEVIANNEDYRALKGYDGFIEDNGFVSMFASNFSRVDNKSILGWTICEDLGHTGKDLAALPLNIKPAKVSVDPEAIKSTAPLAMYDFYSFTAASPVINIYTLPTHELNRDYGMRLAASVDDGPVKILDFKTVGRSEVWKQNVLSNSAQTSFKAQFIETGKHTLKIYMVDPGVILDRITINLGGLQKSYGIIPETRISRMD